MRTTPQAVIVLFAAVVLSGGCGSDSSGGGSPSTCPASDPIECRSPEGKLTGCCPESHPVCSLDGQECNAWSTGGSAGATSGGSGGAAGGSGGTVGGSGGTTGGSGGTTGGSGGTAGGSGGSMTGGSGGSGDTGNCTGPVVEPNDTEATAKHLGTISDCDFGSVDTVSDKLDGANDIDFFSLFGTDGTCVVDPTASTTAQARLCMFADCANLVLTCSAGTAETSPGGRQGCCVTGGGSVKLSIDCKGVSDDATLYLRIDQGAAGQCTSYSVDYHY